MRRVCMLAALLVLGCERKPSLAQRVAARVRERVPGSTVRIVDSATLKAQFKPDAGESELSLENLRLQCGQGEEACLAGIDAVAENAEQIAHLSEDVLSSKDLRFTLKDAAWLDALNKRMSDVPPDKRLGNALVTEPFAADLSVVYVIDQPKGMRMLNVENMKTLGMDLEHVRRVARGNLKTAVPEVPMVPVGADGLWTNEKGDDYDSACLVFLELWKPLTEKLGGKLVVSIPSRNRIFAVGPGTPAQLALLQRATDEAFAEEHHPLSRALLDWAPSGWTVHK